MTVQSIILANHITHLIHHLVTVLLMHAHIHILLLQLLLLILLMTILKLAASPIR